MSWIVPAAQIGAGLIGGKGASHAQGQASAASQAFQQQATQTLNALTGQVNNVNQNYQTNVAPEQNSFLQQLLGSLTGDHGGVADAAKQLGGFNPGQNANVQQASGIGGSLAGFNPGANPNTQQAGGAGQSLLGFNPGQNANVQGAQGAAGQLSDYAHSLTSGNNPLTQAATSFLGGDNVIGRGLSGMTQPFGQARDAATGLGAFTNGGANASANQIGNFSGQTPEGLQSSIGSLANYQGLKPEELSALSTTLGNSGRSSVNTLMSQLGGVANPAALAQNLFNQNQQSALGQGEALAAQAAGQEFAGLQSAGGLQSGLYGQQLGGLESAGSLRLGAGSQQLAGLQSQAGTLSGLSGQQIGAGESQAGLGLQGLQTASSQGLQGLEGLGSLLSGLGINLNSQQLQSLTGGGGLLAQLGLGASGQQLSGMQSGGSLLSQLGLGTTGQQLQGIGESGSLYGNLYGTGVGGAGQQFGQQTGLVSQGMGALGGAASQFGNMANNSAQTAASYGNPWASAMTGIAGGLAGLGGGGGHSSTPMLSAGTYNSPNVYGGATGSIPFGQLQNPLRAIGPQP